MTEPDMPNLAQARILAQYLTGALERIREMVLDPPGGSEASRSWNQQRASLIQSQVQAELNRVQKQIADWSGKAIAGAAKSGWSAGGSQLQAMGLLDKSAAAVQAAQFSLVNFDPLRVLARDTYIDVSRALDSTSRAVGLTLRQMADNGLSVAQVNDIIAGGIVEGKPAQVIADLRQALRAIHGERITIPTRSGGQMEFDTRYYADLVSHTRMREASTLARHQRLAADGIEHVMIQGRFSKNPCTAYIGKIFCLGESDGTYPSIDSIDGPPFHPHCSKTTIPIVLDLVSGAIRTQGRPDQDSQAVAANGVNSPTSRRIMSDFQLAESARARYQRVVDDIRRRAAATGYELPPWSPGARK